MEKETIKTITIIILIALCFTFVLGSVSIVEDKGYYKTQMLNFCEIAHLQEDVINITMSDSLKNKVQENNITLTKLNDCSYYILNYDK